MDRQKACGLLVVALEEARKGAGEGGVPVGAALFRDGRLVSRGRNRRVQRADPVAHAEMDCLQAAGRQATYRDVVLVSTLMPCYMCAGAVVQFGIRELVVGETANYPGAETWLRENGVAVTVLDDEECRELMAAFIERHPDVWNEDIGK